MKILNDLWLLHTPFLVVHVLGQIIKLDKQVLISRALFELPFDQGVEELLLSDYQQKLIIGQGLEFSFQLILLVQEIVAFRKYLWIRYSCKNLEAREHDCLCNPINFILVRIQWKLLFKNLDQVPQVFQLLPFFFTCLNIFENFFDFLDCF